MNYLENSYIDGKYIEREIPVGWEVMVKPHAV
jgi:hypothetical protein